MDFTGITAENVTDTAHVRALLHQLFRLAEEIWGLGGFEGESTFAISPRRIFTLRSKTAGLRYTRANVAIAMTCGIAQKLKTDWSLRTDRYTRQSVA